MNKKLLVLLLIILFAFTSCGKAYEPDITDVTVASESTAVEATDEVVSEASVDMTSETTLSSQSSGKNTALSSPEATTAQIQSATPQAEQAAETQTVTVSINCKNAINYGILNVGTYSQTLSPDGVILADTTVKINDGDSVMKAVKSALKANNISYTITSGGYIKSIAGLSEFDCGAESGWLYKVNGVLPGVSTKSYSLHSGDRVELCYTCVKGDV